MQPIEIGAFASFNMAIMVLAAGKLLHRRLRRLRDFNIPEPVASGLLVSLLVGLLLAVTLIQIVIQNLAGVAMAGLLGLNPLVGLLTGSVSLVGGTARRSPGGPVSPSCTASRVRWRSARPAPPSG